MPIIKELRAFYLPDSAKLGFFRNVGNTEKSAHVLNLGSHQEEGRRKNGDVMCIKGAAGEQAGCNTDPGPAGEPSGAQNGNGLTGKIKDLSLADSD